MANNDLSDLNEQQRQQLKQIALARARVMPDDLNISIGGTNLAKQELDETTNYLYYWSTFVIKEAKERKFALFDFPGKKASKKNFDRCLKLKKPKILFLNGHGNADTITGQDLEPLLECNKKSAVNGTLIYGRSCDAGINLGKKLIKDGAQAFIGYNKQFIFGFSPAKVTRPLTDKLAGLFLAPSNLIVITLLKGNKMQAAQDQSKKAMQKNFKKMLLTSASKAEKYAARWLWSNYKSQVLYGAVAATFKQSC